MGGGAVGHAAQQVGNFGQNAMSGANNSVVGYTGYNPMQHWGGGYNPWGGYNLLNHAGLNNHFWANTVPQFYGHNVQMGGQRFNMTSPGMLGSYALAMNPVTLPIALMMAGGDIGMQSDQQRATKNAYEAAIPGAYGAQNAMNQSMASRGIQGGAAYGQGQRAFQTQLQNPAQFLAMLQQAQMANYNQGLGGLGQLGSVMAMGGF